MKCPDCQSSNVKKMDIDEELMECLETSEPHECLNCGSFWDDNTIVSISEEEEHEV